MNTSINPITKASILICIVLQSFGAKAQLSDTPAQKLKSKRWSVLISSGVNTFTSNGIPQSRNEINFLATNPQSYRKYDQQGITSGLTFQSVLFYQLYSKGKLGLLMNIYRDHDEYSTQSEIFNNVDEIRRDSLKQLSIRNQQAYMNWGLSYEHLVYSSPSGRNNFIVGLASGLSINRTPDRTEYDYNDPNHFIAIDTIGENVWRMTQTRFNNGFFLSPSVDYCFALGKNKSLRIGLAKFYQWNSTQSQLKILNENSEGSAGRKSYTVKATQIKIGFSF